MSSTTETPLERPEGHIRDTVVLIVFSVTGSTHNLVRVRAIAVER